ncbi:MAG: glycogen debranching protein [Oscillatoria sp. PMC 1068.18]|nr:glycogen debranching protein [Oscillatoria sp. PMC 1076.18]MEC4988950.1 glycogen debranching protein [Oscillatoria sp. PMC 1068.18]
MTIWVNEQVDPSGLLYACIASSNEDLAKDCHQSFEKNLTEKQKSAGWVARMRTVKSWDELPANTLKLS